jgi:hypothetical protein
MACPKPTGSGQAITAVIVPPRSVGSSPGAFDMADGRGVRLIRSAAAFPRTDVGGIPTRPLVLWGGRLILRMVFFRLLQEICQPRNVHGSVLPVGLNTGSEVHASTPRTPVTVITLISGKAWG